MHSRSTIALVTALLVGAANAHFFITYPSPIPGSNPKQPLDASGDDFPCHGADLTQGSVTNLNAGEVVPLEFGLGDGANTAVHGGGSCQISLTYETDAAALKNPSSWYVIQSYIGGCPTDFKDNLQTAVMCPTSYPDCVNNINFTVPGEVQNGNAILAWTWFNNIGNREMYMNCAKVSVSGGQNQLSSLPNMMVANINNDCSTTEDTNLDFPNPGKYVQKEATLNFPTQLPSGSGCPTGPGSASVTPMALIGGPNQVAPVSLPPPDTVGGANPPDGAAAGSAAAGAGSPATSSANNGQYTQSATSAAPAATTQAAAPGGSSSGNASAPGASVPTTLATSATPAATSSTAGAGAGAGTASADPPAATGTTSADPPAGTTSADPPAATSTTSADPPAGTGTTSGSCATGQVACTAQGFYCIDSNTFGECAFGCATPMQVAAGTQCVDNAISDAVNYPGPPAGMRVRRREVRRRL